jgi:hypothetical protein
MEPWVASQLPNPMSVAGPTVGWTFDFIPLEPGVSPRARSRARNTVTRRDVGSVDSVASTGEAKAA